ncbi:hypothetical protein KFE25_010897 [Diacronema lutheri]|uniref:Protein kinase domain-containing protein n=1 Tax=Diacronema lutheri TaxID=2081491 RepID=A0A8J5XC39_DIALT|nr:hypothetical protein KFE25_010897 [Diacronema lutheri]
MPPPDHAASTPAGAATPGRWAKAKGLQRCADRPFGCAQSQPATPAAQHGARAELSIAPTHRRPGCAPGGTDSLSSAGSAGSPPARRARTRVACPPTTPSPARFQSVLEFGGLVSPRFSLTPPAGSPPSATLPPALATERPTPDDGDGSCERGARRRRPLDSSGGRTPPAARGEADEGAFFGAFSSDAPRTPRTGCATDSPPANFNRPPMTPPGACGGLGREEPASPAGSGWREDGGCASGLARRPPAFQRAVDSSDDERHARGGGGAGGGVCAGMRVPGSPGCPSPDAGGVQVRAVLDFSDSGAHASPVARRVSAAHAHAQAGVGSASPRRVTAHAPSLHGGHPQAALPDGLARASDQLFAHAHARGLAPPPPRSFVPTFAPSACAAARERGSPSPAHASPAAGHRPALGRAPSSDDCTGGSMAAPTAVLLMPLGGDARGCLSAPPRAERLRSACAENAGARGDGDGDGSGRARGAWPRAAGAHAPHFQPLPGGARARGDPLAPTPLAPAQRERSRPRSVPPRAGVGARGRARTGRARRADADDGDDGDDGDSDGGGGGGEDDYSYQWLHDGGGGGARGVCAAGRDAADGGAGVLIDSTRARENREMSPPRPPSLMHMGSLADTKVLFTLAQPARSRRQPPPRAPGSHSPLPRRPSAAELSMDGQPSGGRMSDPSGARGSYGGRASSGGATACGASPAPSTGGGTVDGGDDGGDEAEATFLFDEQFEYLHLLGAGSFSKVYRVRNRADGREYAVKASKRLFRTRNERKLLLREVENSQLLGEHAHIVCYYRAWQDQRSLYLQLELCERGTLRAHVASIVEHATHAGAATAGGVGSARVGLPEGQAWAFTAQLASGLAHIHAHGLLHLDVKPENILVTRDGMLKIGDLGLCVSAGEWEEQEGDAVYIAPELLQARPSSLCDIFSLGLVLYELAAALELPTLAPSGSDAWHRLRAGELPFPPTPERSAALKELVLRCCAPAPSARPSAAALEAAARSVCGSHAAAAASPGGAALRLPAGPSAPSAERTIGAADERVGWADGARNDLDDDDHDDGSAEPRRMSEDEPRRVGDDDERRAACRYAAAPDGSRGSASASRAQSDDHSFLGRELANCQLGSAPCASTSEALTMDDDDDDAEMGMGSAAE